MVTDSFALWSVKDPLAYLSRLGANKANAESRISVVVYNAVKNVISSTDQADVISGRDGKLAEMITEKIGSSLDSYGIKVKKVETKLRPGVSTTRTTFPNWRTSLYSSLYVLTILP